MARSPLTSSTYARPGSPRAATFHGSRCGRCRTSAGRRADAPAALTAIPVPDGVLLLAVGFFDQCLSGHSIVSLLSRCADHAPALHHGMGIPSSRRSAKPSSSFCGGRHEGQIHPVDLLHVVEVDLGEDDLLANAHRIIAATVERTRSEGSPRKSRIRGISGADQPVQEEPHAIARRQRDRGTDRHAFTQLGSFEIDFFERGSCSPSGR